MFTVVTARPPSRSGNSVRPCATITVPKAQKKQTATSSADGDRQRRAGDQRQGEEQAGGDIGAADHDLLARVQHAIHRAVGQDAERLGQRPWRAARCRAATPSSLWTSNRYGPPHTPSTVSIVA